MTNWRRNAGWWPADDSALVRLLRDQGKLGRPPTTDAEARRPGASPTTTQQEHTPMNVYSVKWRTYNSAGGIVRSKVEEVVAENETAAEALVYTREMNPFLRDSFHSVPARLVAWATYLRKHQPEPEPWLVEVEVLAANAAGIHGRFTYSAPRGTLVPGTRVVVPFGSDTRIGRVSRVYVSRPSHLRAADIKPILGIFTPSNRLHDHRRGDFCASGCPRYGKADLGVAWVSMTDEGDLGWPPQGS